MHPARWNVVIRLGLCLLLLAAPLVWFYLQEPPHQRRQRVPGMEKVYMPGQAELHKLEAAVQAAQQGVAVAPVAFRGVDMGLVACPRYQRLTFAEATAQGAPAASPSVGSQDSVSLLFMSGGNRMAVINGQLYGEGWQMADGRRVASISRRGVRIAGKEGQSFVPWQAPMRVELRQQQPQERERQEPRPEEEPPSEAAATHEQQPDNE